MPEDHRTASEQNTHQPGADASSESSSSKADTPGALAARAPLPPVASSARPPSGTPRPSLPPLTSSGRPVEPNAALPTASPGATRVAAVSAPAQTVRPLTQEIRKPRQDKPPEDDLGIWRMSRKNFLSVAGWFAFTSFIVTAAVGALRLMVPRVLYEPPSAFKAGFPQDYVVGEVNEKYKDEYRVWIVREQDGFYALSAICTHLGCTPRWLPAENKFKCPCHGSGYYKDGINFEGPTPRPLERLKMTLADDGQILVDRNVKFLYEKQEWLKPGAFLKYTG